LIADTLEMEGTWEEILAHQDALRGTRVRLTAWRTEEAKVLPAENARMLAWLEELRRNPGTPEEAAVLDGLSDFRERNPVKFRQPDDLS
jgi:hypothetical protein